MKFLVSLSSLLLLSALAASQCPSDYTAVGNRCLLFLKNVNSNGLESRDICRNYAGDSAIVNDCVILGDIVQHIHDNGLEVVDGYWLGADDVIQEGSFRWIDGTPVASGAPFWGRISNSTNQPTNSFDQDCAGMAVGDGFYFHNYYCDSNSGFAPLCQTSYINGSCPSPYVEVAGMCLQFLTDLDESWDTARLVCQSSNGDLVVVNDCHSMTAIINYANNNDRVPLLAYWIGGYRDTSNVWKWLDGSDMALGVPFWGRAGSGDLQPDDVSGSQNCLELWSQDRYYFNDVSCSLLRSPLCETFDRIPTTAATTFPSTVTSTAPAV